MPTPQHTVKIIHPFGSDDGDGHLFIDGVDYARHVRAAHVTARGGEPIRVVVELAGVESFDGEPTDVVVDERQAELLGRLGWTKPASEEGQA